MIIKECIDWLKALGDAVPSSRTRGLRAVLAGLARNRRGGRWEIGLSSPRPFSSIIIRYFGADSGFNKFRRDAASLSEGFKDAGHRPPPPGFPWLSLDWDLRADALNSAVLYGAHAPVQRKTSMAIALRSGGDRLMLKPRPFSPGMLQGTPASGVFKEISALFPIKDLVTQWALSPQGRPNPSPRWALRFREGVPWRLFICSNIADPFLGESSRMAYLLLDRKVTEIAFEEARLCAYIGA